MFCKNHGMVLPFAVDGSDFKQMHYNFEGETFKVALRFDFNSIWLHLQGRTMIFSGPRFTLTVACIWLGVKTTSVHQSQLYRQLISSRTWVQWHWLATQKTCTWYHMKTKLRSQGSIVWKLTVPILSTKKAQFHKLIFLSCARIKWQLFSITKIKFLHWAWNYSFN